MSLQGVVRGEPVTYCECHGVLSARAALRHLTEEVIELVADPSQDELSDVAYAVNRLAGSLVRRELVRLLPATLHEAKIISRYSTYGCIRSRSHRSCVPRGASNG